MAALDSWSGHALVMHASRGGREVLASILQDYGWRVSVASTGGEGLRILEDTRPLVVIADTELPDLRGTAVLTRIQEIDLDVPVILLRSDVDHEMVLAAIRDGAFDCIEREDLTDATCIPAVERAAAFTRRQLNLQATHEREKVRFAGLDEQIRSLRTQLATTELALDQARTEASNADRAKSSFLANMSHELRTPLNAILGYTELLSEDPASLEPEDITRDLEQIHGAGKHLLRLIGDVLDLARIESGRAELYYETIPMSQLLGQAAARVRKRLGDNELVLPEPPDVEFVSDYAKVLTILDHLLGNAAKFTTGGKITLSARLEDDQLAIDVTDTGIGMSAVQAATIFREFSQADTSTTRRFGGTGLGLTIAHKLTELLNGSIHVESEEGNGSVFTLRMPTIPPSWEELLAETTPVADVEEQTQTVLVIDGDATMRRQMSTFLTKAGYRVISTGSGTEGMRLARLHRPAVISLDVVLPDVDGWNLMMTFKSDPELRDIPVVLVTVSEDRSRGLAVGAADFLPKPIRREALLAVIRRVGPGPSGPILVVEDDEPTRDVTCRMLKGEGLVAEAVENGRRALEWLDANPAPSLILLDLMMPEIDGFHVITELQLRDDWRSIPVVVFTAMDVPPARLAFLESHVDSVIRKGGYGQERVLEQVRQLIARSLNP